MKPPYYFHQPQTVTSLLGVSSDPVAAAECVFIDDLTGDIVVTSLVAAHHKRVSYSEARFYAMQRPEHPFGGHGVDSASAHTMPSRLVTKVTIGCASGPSKPIIAARRFPRPILIRSSDFSNTAPGGPATAAGRQGGSSAGGQSASGTPTSSTSPNVTTYAPAYLVAVSNDTRTIRFFVARPAEDETSGGNGSTIGSGLQRSASPLSSSLRSESGGSPVTAAAQRPPHVQTQPLFTIAVGSYLCAPGTLRFRNDYYHIRAFYWAANADRPEQATKDPLQEAVQSLISAGGNPNRSVYARSKVLLGGGGIAVPPPPESSDAAVRRAMSLAMGAEGSGVGDGGGSAASGSPTGAAEGGGVSAAGALAAELLGKASGYTASRDVARLHTSLQRDQMLVVLTEISVDLVLVDFGGTYKRVAGKDDSSSGKKTSSYSQQASGSGSKQRGASQGDASAAALAAASTAGCSGMLVVLHRIPTRIDYWHTHTAIHVSVLINSAKPTNVKPVAELCGHTWILPQFRIAGLAAVATTSSSPEMQVPGTVPPQHLPSSAAASNAAGPPAASYPLQVLLVDNHLYIAFIDYARGQVVLYRYFHCNENGQRTDLQKAMLAAAANHNNSSSSAAHYGSSSALPMQSSAALDAFGSSEGYGAPLTAMHSVRYFSEPATAAAEGGDSFDSRSSVPLGSDGGAGGTGGVGAGGLSAYATDPYKRVFTEQQVASLVAEGQALPPVSTAAAALAASSSDGIGSSSQNPSMTSPVGLLAPPVLSFASVPMASSPQLSPRLGNISMPSTRSFAAAPEMMASDALTFTPLRQVVAGAVAAIEHGATGGSDGAGGDGAHARAQPSAVQSSFFAPFVLGRGTARGDTSLAFDSTGTLLHTYPKDTDGGARFEVAYILPLPTQSVLMALRCEWYFGADTASAARWYDLPASTAPAQALGHRKGFRSLSPTGDDHSAAQPPEGSTARAGTVTTNANKTGTPPPAAAAGAAVVGPSTLPAPPPADAASIAKRCPVVLQASADGLIYAYFPDPKPPHHSVSPRGTCHLVTAFDLALAIADPRRIRGTAPPAPAPSGRASSVGPVALTDLSRASRSLAHAVSVAACSPAGSPPPEAEEEPEVVGRGTELMGSGGGESAMVSAVASPEASPSPRRNGPATTARGGAGHGAAALAAGGVAGTSLGVTAFRTIAAASSYFSQSFLDNQPDDAELPSVRARMIFAKQRWIGVLTRHRLSEIEAARGGSGVAVAGNGPSSSLGSSSPPPSSSSQATGSSSALGAATTGVSASLHADDTLFREMLGYVYRAASTAGDQEPHPSLQRAQQPSTYADPNGGGGVAATRQSKAPQSDSVPPPRERSWFRSLFSSDKKNGAASGHGADGAAAALTDDFPSAPIVHHLPMDALVTPFEGILRPSTGGAVPTVALWTPSHQQPSIVSVVRSDPLALLRRFDGYVPELWRLPDEDLSNSDPIQAAATAAASSTLSLSRVASVAALMPDRATSAERGLLAAGGRLQRSHSPRADFESSLCFAVQFILGRHVLPCAAAGPSPTAPPLPGLEGTAVCSASAVVLEVLRRCVHSLESLVLVGRLVDVVVSHQAASAEHAAWNDLWGGRLREASAPLAAGATSSEGSSNDPFNVVAFPLLTAALASSGGAPSSLSSASASTSTSTSMGASIAAGVLESIRYLRTLAQPHLWPLNNRALALPDAFLQTAGGSGGGASGLWAGCCPRTVTLVPGGISASAVFATVLEPLIRAASGATSTATTQDTPPSAPGTAQRDSVTSGQLAAASSTGDAAATLATAAERCGAAFLVSYTLQALLEYARALVQQGLPVPIALQSSIMGLLLQSPPPAATTADSPDHTTAMGAGGGAESDAAANYFRLHQLLMYRALEDHVPTALQLIALQDAYPPAFQLGLDILGRLRAHAEVVSVFVARRLPLRAAKYLLSVGASCLTADEAVPLAVAVLEAAAALHDADRAALLTGSGADADPSSSASPTGAGREEGQDTQTAVAAAAVTPAMPEADRIAVYLERRLAKKKARLQRDLTPAGSQFVVVFTMVGLQLLGPFARMTSTALQPPTAAVMGRSPQQSASGYGASRNGLDMQADTLAELQRAFPPLKPFATRFNALNSGSMI